MVSATHQPDPGDIGPFANAIAGQYRISASSSWNASSVGATLGEPFTAFTSAEMVVPANITGVAPVAMRDEIILVLGDLRGDVWMMDL